MSSGLATRCPSCGTVFRVVADQLRVSEGWVRCGRCAEVFNASEQLLDLGSVTPSAPMPLQAPDAPRTPAAPPQDPDQGALAAQTPRAAPSGATREEPAAAVDFELTLDPPPGPGEPGPLRTEPVRTVLPDPHELFDPPERSAASPAPDTADTADIRPDIGLSPSGRTPTFMRRAERAERWRKPWVRGALGAATALGVLLLIGQALYAYRDLAAARFAGLRAPLESACELLGCRVGAPHAIESLAVESSGLVRVEKSSVYKLSVAVRNRAGIDLAVPALDLTLTDAQGKLLARRVLRAAEFGVGTTVVAAGSDLLFQASLQAGTEPIAGYTIDLFYP